MSDFEPIQWPSAKELGGDNKPPAIRRSDLEDLADSICRHVSYFIGRVIMPEDGCVNRNDIAILQRYLETHFCNFSRMKFYSVKVKIHAPWMGVEKCHGGGKFNITLHYYEDDGPLETAHMEFQCKSKTMQDRNGTEVSNVFETELLYMCYD